MHLQHFCSLSCAVQTRVLCFKTVAWIVKWSRCSTTQAVIFFDSERRAAVCDERQQPHSKYIHAVEGFALCDKLKRPCSVLRLKQFMAFEITKGVV